MIDFLTSWPFICIYIFYSVIGWLYLSKYFIQCAEAKIQGFGGSLFAIIAMPILCGGITTIMLFYTFIKALNITYKQYKNGDFDEKP